MRNSTAILATVALGAVLAIGAATASMARGGGGHGGGATPFIMNHGGGFSGGRSFGGHPFVMSNGGDRSFDGRRHFGGFRGRDDSDAFFGFGPVFGLVPFWGPNQYWAYNNDAAYCERLYRSYDPASGTFLGRDGLRHYCP